MEGITQDLMKELRKSYEVVQKVHKEWQATQDSSFVFIESLLNLTEQLQCCNEGAFETELLNDFPDLKQRLAYKILKALESKMRRLYDLLNTFENLKGEIENLRKSTFQVYQNTANLSVEMLTKGSPTCPPVATLLEWLVDINRWYNNLYEQKKDLLDNICYHDNKYLQSLPKSWKDETCLYRVKDIMEQLSVFQSSFLA